MTDNHQPEFDPTVFVRVDRPALLNLDPVERFQTCQIIRKHGVGDQVDDIRNAAVAELADRYERIHGTNTKVADLLGVTPAFVGRLLTEADANAESFEQTRARLDREDVEDITGSPKRAYAPSRPSKTSSARSCRVPCPTPNRESTTPPPWECG
ncbi:hypothetical protein KGD82_16215 [Nocardiopsis eucommiae]|uniref:Uncharacterized protein n=1 Tax=Nocardiopsis eucommiae TaxID=2831970 RepID=A0A975QHY1_9ACTN|nr:hypothetical protein KGD82_16215 [Nocardiopsis eucommiae]